MKRILLTGAGGVVGTATEIALRRSGDEIVVLKGRQDADLESFEQTRALFRFVKPTHVVHLAGAVYGVGGNLAFPGDAIRRNLLINTHVVAAASEAKAQKILAMGTTAIYSDEAEQPFREDQALTGAPHGSELPYAYAKRAMLVQLEAYRQQFGLAFAYAIATNMYGPNDRFDPVYGHVAPSLIAKFAAAAESGDEVEVWGDGTPTRDFLYSEDAADALVLLLEKGDGSYNVASGVSAPVRALVEEVAARFPGVAYKWNVDKPKGQAHRAYDVSRIKALGFAPRHGLQAGVRKTIDWYLANKDAARGA
jgi:GDP-L-fucose synthase